MIERTFLADQVFTLSNVLSLEECRQQIVLAQETGFDGQVYGTRGPTEIRRRAVREDSDWTAMFWQRIAPFLPPLDQLYRAPLVPEPLPAMTLSAYQATGLNQRLRYYWYEPGERFPPHFDIAYEESPTSRSFLTVIVYLNDGYRGGETQFGVTKVNPQAGVALLFPHELRHEGVEIIEGRKCVLRTDVMYRHSCNLAEND